MQPILSDAVLLSQEQQCHIVVKVLISQQNRIIRQKQSL
nr:MAG TPA: hypothetical protein [Bacteriophage sp.]